MAKTATPRQPYAPHGLRRILPFGPLAPPKEEYRDNHNQDKAAQYGELEHGGTQHRLGFWRPFARLIGLRGFERNDEDAADRGDQSNDEERLTDQGSRSERHPNRVQNLDKHQNEKQAVNGNDNRFRRPIDESRAPKRGRRTYDPNKRRKRNQYTQYNISDDLNPEEDPSGDHAERG